MRQQARNNSFKVDLLVARADLLHFPARQFARRGDLVGMMLQAGIDDSAGQTRCDLARARRLLDVPVDDMHKHRPIVSAGFAPPAPLRGSAAISAAE